MKFISKGLIYLSVLSLFYACGKNNESGKSWNYNNPYSSPYGAGTPYSTINSPYSYGGTSVNMVLQQNPCVGGFSGIPGFTSQPYAGQRVPIQVPLTNFPTVIPPGDIYVGVTSFGDVAVVAGQQAGQPPLFTGYMCPRSFAPTGQGQLMGVKVGAYSNCLFKPVTASTVVFPGGATAEFRWMDGGSSMRQKFSFCR